MEAVPESKAIECPPWSIAVFAARETLEEVTLTLEKVLSAVSKPSRIDLLINGNEPLAMALADWLASNPSTETMASIRVWAIAQGDKAHAWNQYIYFIWPGSDFTFFVDGYVRPDQNAFKLLEACLLESSQTLGATGVPRSGRSARKLREEMIAEGGIHGNLYCLKQETVKRIIESEFRLPLGIYRTDSTLGAALMFNLDPAHNDWEPARIRVQPEASWETRKRDWWRCSDLKSQAKRILRQQQGVLENRAVRQHLAIRRAAVGTLPTIAADLVLEWVRQFPDEARIIAKRNIFYQLTLKKLRQPRDWQAANIPPKLLCVQYAH